ncbi:MAG: right-handed parallel beta-helix repeat-containing protein [Waterburya sp.]
MATYNVTNSNDSGAGSLRDAIAQANANAGLDTIVLNDNITLSSAINITDSVEITGTNSVITQTGSDRLFKIDNGATSLIDVSLTGLTLTGGKPVELGGAVYTVENLTLDNVVVEGNATTKRGGGVYSEGATLVLNDSVFRNNEIADGTTSSGGAFYVLDGVLEADNILVEDNKSFTKSVSITNSTAKITNSKFSNNSGGGIFLTTNAKAVINNVEITNNKNQISGAGIGIENDSEATISNSIISNNQSTYGGGILIADSTAEISNTQITNNIATEAGGGIDVIDGATITIRNSTISGNSSPIGSGLETYNNAGVFLVDVTVTGNTGSAKELEGDNIRFGTSPVDPVDPIDPIDPVDPTNYTPSLELAEIHRFYQHEKGFHLYTSDVTEIADIQAKSQTGELAYNYESEKFNVLSSDKDALTGADIAGAEEVYRFFNTQTGAHLYTMDEVEKDHIQNNLSNYNYEGIKFYAFEEAQENIETVPVFRMLNGQSGSHLFTVDQTEINYIQNNLPNFSIEGDNGVAFYVMEL